MDKSHKGEKNMDKSITETAQKMLQETPYITSDTISEEAYDGFLGLTKALRERREDDHRLLNPKNVTGVWLLPYLEYEEGNPHILIRSSVPTGSFERTLLHNEIYEFIKNDVVYDYNRDIIGGDSLIKGQQAELFGEIENGRVYTIYDKEREQ